MTRQELNMTRQELNARKIARLEAQGKRCNGLVLHHDGRLESCLLSATFEYEGEKYCRLHYPPDQIKRAVQSMRTRISRYEREIEKMQKSLKEWSHGATISTSRSVKCATPSTRSKRVHPSRPRRFGCADSSRDDKEQNKHGYTI